MSSAGARQADGLIQNIFRGIIKVCSAATFHNFFRLQQSYDNFRKAFFQDLITVQRVQAFVSQMEFQLTFHAIFDYVNMDEPHKSC
jgi:hypothetical protein